MPLVNDVHSELNPTRVKDVVRPSTVDELRRTVTDCARRGEPFSICGARHAMGAQQFLTEGVLVDMTSLARVCRWTMSAAS